MYILHLSDLHFGNTKDANRWYKQLARDLHKELKCNSLDALVLSGDIASNSTSEEYEAAREFIIDLMIDFRLKWSEVVIVPGNHDFDEKRAKKAYTHTPREDYHGPEDDSHIFDKGEGDSVEVLDSEKYKQRFTNFRDFYKTAVKKPYPLEPEWQYTLHHFPDHDLLILGLNSAWQLDPYYQSRTSINLDALTNAMAEINDNSAYKKSRLKIAVWHHPLNSPFEDRIKDHGFLEQLAESGFRLALHGHIHRANEEDFKKVKKYTRDNQINIIAAGTFGTGISQRQPGSPWQYNLLEWEGKRLTVYTRKRTQPNGVWQPYTMWGNEDKIPASPDHPHLSYYEIDKLLPAIEPDPALESHYEKLIKAIFDGSIVPFLGADINLCDRPSKAKDFKPSDWQEDGLYPPTNLELAAYIDRRTNGENCDYLLRGRCPLISDTSFGGRSKELPPECPLRTGLVTRLDLQRVSQYFDRNPGQLEVYINSIYNQSSYQPNSLHQFLVRLIKEVYTEDYSVDTDKPGATPYPLIVTTCFDRTLERAFERESQSFDLISYTSSEKQFIHQRFDCQDGGKGRSWPKGEIISDEKKHAAFLQERPVILRLYGPVNWESERSGENFAITEDHFLDYLACDISHKLPTKLWNKLLDSRLWFLGYSLSYWNLRFIIRQIIQERKKRYPASTSIKWWAVQEKPEILDEEIWNKSHVKFFKAQQIGSLEKYLQQIDQQLTDKLNKLPQPPARR